MTDSGVPIPDDLVLVGYVTGAYGIRGWVRITAYSPDADALLHAKTWWLDKPAMHDVEMLESKLHGGDIVARLMGVEDRTRAEALKGAQVHVARRYFPPLADNEFYWIDLIGLTVENLQGEQLGTVSDLMDNGAHPILRVALSLAGPEGGKRKELLIPFVDRYVMAVDQQQKKITVDWGLDY